MVRLEATAFASAAARMCELSGVKKTRLSVKLRRSEGKIYLKMTDDRTVLTSTLMRQSELKVLEQIVSQYVSRCVADAPQEELTAAAAKKAAAAAAAAAAVAVPEAPAAASANTNNTNNNTKKATPATNNNSKGGKGKKK